MAGFCDIFLLPEYISVLQELNLSFGEITEDAALAVAQAVKDKSQLEKLDLNGTEISKIGINAYLILIFLVSCLNELLICFKYVCCYFLCILYIIC